MSVDATLSLRIVHLLAAALIASGSGVWLARASERGALDRVDVGSRGLQRAIALRDAWLFAAVEPLVRWLSTWVSRLRLSSLRPPLSVALQRAGNYLGLDVDELIAFGVVVTVFTTGLGACLGFALDVPVRAVVLGVVAGPAWLAFNLKAQRQQRELMIDRGLPAVIDLIAMCVGAGLDFPGAVRLVTDDEDAKKSVLCAELKMTLRELELGHTRAHVLRNLADRVPTRSVCDFAFAVIQAEEKGTPLAEVLRIQATVLRGRRSVLAEEAASRAGVLMMLPLVLLLACVMLIAMGGMAIRSMESGL